MTLNSKQLLVQMKSLAIAPQVSEDASVKELRPSRPLTSSLALRESRNADIIIYQDTQQSPLLHHLWKSRQMRTTTKWISKTHSLQMRKRTATKISPIKNY